MIDIVFPNNNEEDFIKLAAKLNITELVFVYDSPEKFYKKKAQSVKIFNGLKINEKNKNLRNLADITISCGDQDSREIIERIKPDVIYSLEEAQRKDFIHQRASGMNHVIAKLAKDKDIIVCFDFSGLLNDKNLSLRLGRIMQNILLCRKFKIQTCIASFSNNPYGMRSLLDLRSFFETLGMSDIESKNAIYSIKKRIGLNSRKKSESYLREGLEII